MACVRWHCGSLKSLTVTEQSILYIWTLDARQFDFPLKIHLSVNGYAVSEIMGHMSSVATWARSHDFLL